MMGNWVKSSSGQWEKRRMKRGGGQADGGGTISPITDIFEFEMTFTSSVGDVRKMAEH